MTPLTFDLYLLNCQLYGHGHILPRELNKLDFSFMATLYDNLEQLFAKTILNFWYFTSSEFDSIVKVTQNLIDWFLDYVQTIWL